MTKGGLFLSMLCLSALNTMSGLLPSSPPVIQFQEGSRGVTQPTGAAPNGQILPMPGPLPITPGETELGWVAAVCAQSLGSWGCIVLDENYDRGNPRLPRLLAQGQGRARMSP